ncbi:MAG: nitric oxide reductase activation protein NorD [Sporichthyaceae bacterium]
MQGSGAIAEERALVLDPAERLSLLAHAVVGRRVVVLSGVEQRPWSDGQRIFTSNTEDAAAVADGLVVQSALIAAGSLEPRGLARLTGQRRLRLRYLTLESMRAVALMEEVLPPRVAAKVTGLYDGAIPRSREDSLRRAADMGEPVPEAPPWLGSIKPGRVLMASTTGRGEPTAADTRADNEPTLPELDDEQDSEESRLARLLNAPVAPGPLARYLQKLLGAGRTPGTDGGSGQDLPPASSSRAAQVGHKARRLQEEVACPMSLELRPAGRLYPEWDLHRREYRQNWCAVAQFDPVPTDREGWRCTPDPALMRSLARISPQLERWRGQDLGDDLDLTGLVDHAVARRAGPGGEPRVYEARRRSGRGLGVLVLLDATGSTGGRDETGCMFDDQRNVAANLTEALDALGDRVALYAFQSWGRANTNFLRVKGFEDRYDDGAVRRLASLEPGGFTRLGAAVRHAETVIREEAGTAHRLLIVVGDGLPYDDGYEHEYAEADSRRALDSAIAAGVGCVHLDIRSGNTQEIRRLWGAFPHLRLNSPEDLAGEIVSVLGRALKVAGAGRRLVDRDAG